MPKVPLQSMCVHQAQSLRHPSPSAGSLLERERAAVGVYRYNTVVKAWHAATSFPLQDPLPFRCAVLGDRIYCVNRSHTLQFEVREEQEGFLQEVLPSPTEARGALLPFVLTLDQDQ